MEKNAFRENPVKQACKGTDNTGAPADLLRLKLRGSCAEVKHAVRCSSQVPTQQPPLAIAENNNNN